MLFQVGLAWRIQGIDGRVCIPKGATHGPSYVSSGRSEGARYGKWCEGDNGSYWNRGNEAVRRKEAE